MEEEVVNLGIIAGNPAPGTATTDNNEATEEGDTQELEKEAQSNEELCQILMDRIHKALEKGEDLNSVYDGNKTLLSAAVEVNDLNAAEILLKKGVKTNVLSNLADSKYRLIVMRRETPLMTASRLGLAEMCRLLLQHGALVNEDSELEADLGSALHWAANRGHLECVKILVENSANLDAQASHGATALMDAVLEDHFDIIKYLIEKDVNINLPLFVNEEDIEDTPLLVSMLLGQDNNVDFFIKSGSRLVLTDRVTDVFGTYTNYLGRGRLKALILMVLLSGANITAQSLLKHDELGYLQLDRDLRTWLGAFKSNPLTLSQLTRIAIRKHLKAIYADKGILHRINRLPLPQFMMNYLKLDIVE